MKNLFLLFTCIVLLLILKTSQENLKFKIERLDVYYSEVIDFTGKLYLPKTLTYEAKPVNKKVRGILELRIAGKIYKYKQKLVNYGMVYELEEGPDEIWLKKGSRIETEFENSNLGKTEVVTLFVEKEEE